MQKAKAWIIRRLGGYVDINDLVDQEADQETRREILTRAVRKHFNTISADDILKETTEGWRFEGEPLPDHQQKLLISESEQIINSLAWKVITADVKYLANKKMFLTAANLQDVDNGKFWLYILDMLRTRLQSLSKGRGVYNSKQK